MTKKRAGDVFGADIAADTQGAEDRAFFEREYAKATQRGMEAITERDTTDIDWRALFDQAMNQLGARIVELEAQLERQEAACAHCAYCVMTQDASSVAPVVADGSATEERLEPEVSPRRSGPSNLARDAAGATPPNQENEQ